MGGAKPSFQNTFILRKTRVANPADINNNSTIFTKTTFKNSNGITLPGFINVEYV